MCEKVNWTLHHYSILINVRDRITLAQNASWMRQFLWWIHYILDYVRKEKKIYTTKISIFSEWCTIFAVFYVRLDWPIDHKMLETTTSTINAVICSRAYHQNPIFSWTHDIRVLSIRRWLVDIIRGLDLTHFKKKYKWCTAVS